MNEKEHEYDERRRKVKGKENEKVGEGKSGRKGIRIRKVTEREDN